MIARSISTYLESHGIKQTWLADQLGIPVTTLNGIITGKTKLKADLFIEICRVLNVSPETFAEKQKE